MSAQVTPFPSGSDNYKHHPARRGAEPIVRLSETEGRWSEDEPPRILGYALGEHRCGHKCAWLLCTPIYLASTKLCGVTTLRQVPT